MTTKWNLTLDLSLLTVFLALASPHFTGQTIHEWLGLTFLAALVLHLYWHWDWLAAVLGRFFQKLFHQSRFNLVVDALFFIAMTGSLFSGLLISKELLAFFGISLGQVSRGWEQIHHQMSDASLILLGIHFALHWRWVLNSLGRYVLAPLRGFFSRPSAKPQEQA